MHNLFGFNPEYIDRDAGLSESEKYRKWVSKANVDMVLNNFSPFNKVKNLKAPTQTIVSIDGTNIENTEAPVVFHASKTNKSNKIYVNNEYITRKLEDVPIDKRLDKFKTMMKGAYVARSDIAAMDNRSSTDQMGISMVDDYAGTTPLIGKEKIQAMQDIHRQMLLTAQTIMYGCHIISDTTKLSSLAESEKVLDLAHAMASGSMPKSTWAQRMLGDIKTAGKSRSLYNTWADELAAKIEINHGTVNQQDMDVSEFGDVLNADLPMTRKYYAVVRPKDEPGKSKEACKTGNGTMKYNDEPTFAEDVKNGDVDFTDTNDMLERDDMKLSTRSIFFKDNRKIHYETEWNKRDVNMERLAEALYESLVGRVGKRNSESPAKRLNVKSLASGINDNIYRSKLPLGGKHLSLNLLLDTSGSMGGSHIEDGIDVINCINKLAMRGVIDGNLMLSCSGASAMLKLPVNPNLIPTMSAHNGGEGFRHTMALRWKELQAADYNVAITDGQLTDGYIDMKQMHKEGIEITGLYSMRSASDNKASVLKYSGSLKRWFTNSAVRANAEEMIYYLIDNAILSYDSNPRRST